MIDLEPDPKRIRAALIGTPSPMMLWLVHAFKAMLWALGPERAREVWPLDEASIEQILSTEKTAALYAATDMLTPALEEALLREAALVLVVLAEPAISVEFLMNRDGSTFADATRVASAGLAQITRLAQSEPAVVIPASAAALPAGTFLAHLARLVFDQDLAVFQEALERIGIDLTRSIREQFSLFAAPAGGQRALADAERDLVEQACQGIYDYILGQGEPSVLWSLPFFIEGTKFVAPPPRTIQLLGPARLLYFGPFLSLPRGHWRGELVFGLSQDILESHFRVDVMQQQVLVTYQSVARKGGIYSLPFEFHLRNPHTSVEVRFSLDRGEIEGHVAMGQVKLTRIGEADFPDTPDRFAVA